MLVSETFLNRLHGYPHIQKTVWNKRAQISAIYVCVHWFCGFCMHVSGLYAADVGCYGKWLNR
jgi:hypothetical protein